MLQPVEQGLAHAIGGRAKPGGVRKAHTPAAPAAADDADEIAAPRRRLVELGAHVPIIRCGSASLGKLNSATPLLSFEDHDERIRQTWRPRLLQAIAREVERRA